MDDWFDDDGKPTDHRGWLAYIGIGVFLVILYLIADGDWGTFFELFFGSFVVSLVAIPVGVIIHFIYKSWKR